MIYIYTEMYVYSCLPPCLSVYPSSEGSNKSCWNSCTNSVKLQIIKKPLAFLSCTLTIDAPTKKLSKQNCQLITDYKY